MIRWAHRKGTFKARNRLQGHELRQQLGLEQTTGSHDPLSSIPVSSAALAALTPTERPTPSRPAALDPAGGWAPVAAVLLLPQP